MQVVISITMLASYTSINQSDEFCNIAKTFAI